MDESTQLAELARVWGRSLDADTTDRLLKFCRLLLDWSGHINLTGARSLSELVGRHLPDSFAASSVATEGESVIDVGSGGGLPGLPFAILRPECPIVLAEARAKRAAFLRTAVRTLGLNWVSVLPQTVRVPRGRLPSDAPFEGRVTELCDPPGASFDLAMSRATLPLPEWLELGSKLVAKGKRVIAFVSTRPPASPRGLTEVRALPYALMDGTQRWLAVYERST